MSQSLCVLSVAAEGLFRVLRACSLGHYPLSMARVAVDRAGPAAVKELGDHLGRLALADPGTWAHLLPLLPRWAYCD